MNRRYSKLCTVHARLLGSKTAPGIVAEHQPTEEHRPRPIGKRRLERPVREWQEPRRLDAPSRRVWERPVRERPVRKCAVRHDAIELAGFALWKRGGAYRIRKRWATCGGRRSLAACCGFRRRRRQTVRWRSGRLRCAAGDLCSGKHRRRFRGPRARGRSLGMARETGYEAPSFGTSRHRRQPRLTRRML